jgi:hypothetical protein
VESCIFRGAAARAVHQLECRTLEISGAIRKRAVSTGDVDGRVEVLHLALYLDAAILRVDGGLVRGQQPLPHLDCHAT